MDDITSQQSYVRQNFTIATNESQSGHTRARSHTFTDRPTTLTTHESHVVNHHRNKEYCAIQEKKSQINKCPTEDESHSGVRSSNNHRHCSATVAHTQMGTQMGTADSVRNPQTSKSALIQQNGLHCKHDSIQNGNKEQERLYKLDFLQNLAHVSSEKLLSGPHALHLNNQLQQQKSADYRTNSPQPQYIQNHAAVHQEGLQTLLRAAETPKVSQSTNREQMQSKHIESSMVSQMNIIPTSILVQAGDHTAGHAAVHTGGHVAGHTGCHVTGHTGGHAADLAGDYAGSGKHVRSTSVPDFITVNATPAQQSPLENSLTAESLQERMDKMKSQLSEVTRRALIAMQCKDDGDAGATCVATTVQGPHTSNPSTADNSSNISVHSNTSEQHLKPTEEVRVQSEKVQVQVIEVQKPQNIKIGSTVLSPLKRSDIGKIPRSLIQSDDNLCREFFKVTDGQDCSESAPSSAPGSARSCGSVETDDTEALLHTANFIDLSTPKSENVVKSPLSLHNHKPKHLTTSSLDDITSPPTLHDNPPIVPGMIQLLKLM